MSKYDKSNKIKHYSVGDKVVVDGCLFNTVYTILAIQETGIFEYEDDVNLGKYCYSTFIYKLSTDKWYSAWDLRLATPEEVEASDIRRKDRVVKLKNLLKNFNQDLL